MLPRSFIALLSLSTLFLVSVTSQSEKAIARGGNPHSGYELAHQNSLQASRGITFPYQTHSQQQLTALILDQKRATQKITIMAGSFPKGDELTISKSRVIGKQLKIDVSYSGGCKSHSFNLYWNGAYQESFPPQVRMKLVHNANNDACEKLVKETLVFDIRNLQPSILRLTTDFGYSKSIDLTR